MNSNNGASSSYNNNNSSSSSSSRIHQGNVMNQALQQFSSLTARKFTLPDKNVASQVLMYRQLLHTKCRPGLKLSRDYQATPAQIAVKDMPWWTLGIEETRKMVISYDNLIQRLWLHGAIFAYQDNETLLNEEAQPPIPHPFWVNRCGFQQEDPVTDFRSGGVLSLAMLVHIVESCPHVHQRFVEGDAAVLPFAITSINITDMMAQFLMLAKKVDRMDALLSQKPFWRMFSDPNALLVCQELSLDMLADVVVELQAERDAMPPRHSSQTAGKKVTVFDFSQILETTKRRVEYDLLGAGPKSVEELRQIHQRICAKYQQQLANRVAKLRGEEVPPPKVVQQANELGKTASGLATGLWSRFRQTTGPALEQVRGTVRHEVSRLSHKPSADTQAPAVVVEPTVVALPPRKPTDPVHEVPPVTTTTTTTAAAEEAAAATTMPSEKAEDKDSDWTRLDATTDAMGEFAIGDDEDDDIL